MQVADRGEPNVSRSDVSGTKKGRSCDTVGACDPATVQETLDFHIARDRRAALADGRALPQSGTGSVLFADIASFSRLTEDLLDAAGPSRGAEELTRSLDQIYDALIGSVHTFGGAVITFSGDAITCYFPDDDGLLAASAGEAMIRAVSEITISVAETFRRPVRLKVGLAHGTVRRMAPGDPAVQRIDTIAGDPVMDAVACERLAEPGEVVLAPSMCAALGDRAVVGESRGDGYRVLRSLKAPASPRPWPVKKALDPSVASPWTHSGVRDSILTGRAGFLAELRTVVSLFVRFSGIDFAGDPEAESKLDAFVRFAQGVLGAIGGTLLSVTVGDKGSYLYAAFGAPTSFEDDCSRAVVAALALLSRPSHLDFIENLGVGLSRGRMRVGTLGGSSRRTYTTIGHDANIAARLMERAAPGEVLATVQVVSGGASSTHMFDPLGTVTVKGRNAPLQVLRCVRRKRPESYRTYMTDDGPIVGRDDLIAQFEEALDELEKGNGGALLITGEGGIGKSRIVRAFIEHVALRGRPYYLASAEAIEQRTAYHAWRQVFHTALGLHNLGGDEGRIRDQVRARAAFSGDAKLAPLLAPVLSVPFPDNETTSSFSGEVRADRARDLMASVLLPKGETLTPVLFIDNAHWLDSASWALLTRLRAERSDLLVVVTTRPIDTESIPRDISLLTEHPRTRSIALGALEREPLAVLVRNRLTGSDIDESAIDFIFERTSGHPFFTEELLHAYLEEHPIESGFKEQRITRESFAATDFPATIEGVVTSRLDRLPPELLLALKVACVLGRSFRAETLVAVHPDVPEVSALTSALESMCTRGLLIHEDALGGFTFRHAILQKVTYDRMLFAQRRELHARAAGYYEELNKADLDPHYAVLAYHHEQAEQIESAVACSDKAAAHAVRNGAYDEAIRFIERATRLDPKSRIGGAEQRVKRLQILGEAQQCMGLIRESRAVLERILAELGRPVPTSTLAAAGRAFLEVGAQLLHRLAPFVFLRKTSDAEGRAFASLVLRDLQPAYFVHNALVHMAYATLRAVNLAEGALGHPLAEQVRAEGYAAAVLIASAVGAEKVAEGYRRRALATGEATGDDTTLGQVWVLLALHSVGIGQCVRAYDEADQARLRFVRAGHRRRFEIARGTMGWAAGYAGRFEAGMEAWHDVRKAAFARGDRQSGVHGLVGLADILLTRGRDEDVDEASRWTAQVTEQLALEQDRMIALFAIGLRGVVAARRGLLGDALADFESAVAEAEASVPLSGYAMSAYSLPAEALLDMVEEGLIPVTHPLVRRAVHAISRFAGAFSLGRPRAARSKARFLALTGSIRRARRLLLTAASRAAALGLAVDAVRCRIDLARLDPSKASLQEALAEAKDLELVYKPSLLDRRLAARDA